MQLRTAPIPQYSWLSHRHSFALTLLYAGMLALPPLGWLLDVQGAKLSENRNLAPPPDFRHTRLADLPARIESYYDDHVGFRAAIIRGSGIFFYRWLKEPSDQVLIGKPPAPGQPPFYFYASEGILDDRLGFGSLTPAQLEAWKKSLERRAAWLHRRGIEYLFVVPPEKSTVYPGLLPDYLRSSATSVTRLDQFARYMTEARSPVAFLDLRPAMRQAKADGTLFFPYDTHWNGLGAYYGYRAIANALRQVPGALGRDFEIRAGPESLHIDLASMLGLAPASSTPLLDSAAKPRVAASEWPPDVDPSLNSNKGFYALEALGKRGRLLVFHDSFFVAPLFSPESQPLATHFARSYFAWLPPSDEALERFVEWEHPDIVIEERAERLLRIAPPPPAPLDPVTPRLRRSAGAPAFSVDRINDARPRNEHAVSGGELRLEGSALDAAGVEILIDDVLHPAAYGLEAPELENQSGFLADFSVADLSPGLHTVNIRVISADGASYSEAAWGRVRIVK
jgi:alginate O-acetyltransferase complex protein AlgJ